MYTRVLTYCGNYLVVAIIVLNIDKKQKQQNNKGMYVYLLHESIRGLFSQHLIGLIIIY